MQDSELLKRVVVLFRKRQGCVERQGTVREEMITSGNVSIIEKATMTVKPVTLSVFIM